MKHIDTLSTLSKKSLSAVFFGLFFLIAPLSSAQAGTSSLKILLGSWGGGGIMKLDDGSSERLRCNGYYTGGGTQLGMVIRCTSSNQKIEMRSKLSLNANRLTGVWEERTFNAEGKIDGKIGNGKMNMSITGAVSGAMQVQFSQNRQKVFIKTNNVGFTGVTITLKRR